MKTNNFFKVNTVMTKVIFISACIALVREDTIGAGLLLFIFGVLTETKKYL